MERDHTLSSAARDQTQGRPGIITKDYTYIFCGNVQHILEMRQYSLSITHAVKF